MRVCRFELLSVVSQNVSALALMIVGEDYSVAVVADRSERRSRFKLTCRVAKSSASGACNQQEDCQKMSKYDVEIFFEASCGLL